MSDPPEEGHYWSLLESTQQQQYPDFLEHLRGQIGEEGRAAVIQFQDGTKPSVKNLRSSRALRRYLNEPQPTGSVCRRAFVLEGLPRNFIQVLGARLRVPPAFFASHWTSPGRFTGHLLNRTPRHYDNKNRFNLTFLRLHRARINAPKGGDPHLFYMESSVHSHLSRTTIFGDPDGPLSSLEKLSFWSTCNTESWDVILLVDPPLGKFVTWKDSRIPREIDRDISIKLVDSIMEELVQRGSWYPSCSSRTILGPNSTDWENAEQSPGMESLFDDICLLYPLTESENVADPASCTDICRRIVLSAWTARIRIAEAQVIQEQYRMSIGNKVDESSAASWLDKSWARPWDPRDFGRLVRAKSALESIEWELYRNMDALGICSGTQNVEAWETEAWKSLQKVVQMLKARLDIILQAYTQAVSVRESITSNKQARQVGYLTSLATLFIPISFVAAIFSMGGEFSAGASHFWVYWVIAVPVVAIGCLLLFTELGGRVLGNLSGEHSLV